MPEAYYISLTHFVMWSLVLTPICLKAINETHAQKQHQNITQGGLVFVGIVMFLLVELTLLATIIGIHIVGSFLYSLGA